MSETTKWNANNVHFELSVLQNTRPHPCCQFPVRFNPYLDWSEMNELRIFCAELVFNWPKNDAWPWFSSLHCNCFALVIFPKNK